MVLVCSVHGLLLAVGHCHSEAGQTYSSGRPSRSPALGLHGDAPGGPRLMRWTGDDGLDSQGKGASFRGPVVWCLNRARYDCSRLVTVSEAELHEIVCTGYWCITCTCIKKLLNLWGCQAAWSIENTASQCAVAALGFSLDPDQASSRLWLPHHWDGIFGCRC